MSRLDSRAAKKSTTATLAISEGWGGAAAGLVGLMYLTTKYVKRKIALWLDPWSADPQVEGFQFRQGMYSIASGGLLGRGLGESNQKYAARRTHGVP